MAAVVRGFMGLWLAACAVCVGCLADERPLAQEHRLTSPLARDIERRLEASGRAIDHELSLEHSRVNAPSATPFQRWQTSRDVQITGQRLNTLKTQAPDDPSIPRLERRFDRVSRPVGRVPARGLGLGSQIGGSRR